MANQRFFTVEAKCSAVVQFVFGEVKYMFLSEKQTGENMIVLNEHILLSQHRRKYKVYKDLWERKLRGLNEDEESTVLPKIQV